MVSNAPPTLTRNRGRVVGASGYVGGGQLPRLLQSVSVRRGRDVCFSAHTQVQGRPDWLAVRSASLTARLCPFIVPVIGACSVRAPIH